MPFRCVAFCAVAVILTAAAPMFAGEGSKSLWRPDAYTAWKASQASGRPALFYVTSAHCPYCALMERETLSHPAVKAMLRESFEAAKVHADRQPALAQNLRVHTYPTTVVVDSQNRIVGLIEGYVPPQEFERRLTEVASR